MNNPENGSASNSAQMAASAYRLPALDAEFLMGESMRGVRFLLEYAKAEESLKAWGVRSTIVVFGSARIMPGGSDDPNKTSAALMPGQHPRAGKDSGRLYEEARRFGMLASQKGGALHPENGLRDNVIATGGGPGIMEAANRGASEAGAPSIGFNIRLPFEQEPNAYSTPDLTFQFHYFAMRKMHLAMRAAALVVFPGGFGTMDELFEILTLRQTGKAPVIPIILFGRDFWTRVINFEAILEEGMISQHDLELFDFADTAEEAWECLVKKGLAVRTGPAKDI